MVYNSSLQFSILKKTMLFSSSGKNTSHYRLKVTAGPEYDPSTHQTVPVNAEKALHIENEHAIINLRVRIQDYTGEVT
jgi:hypothetical protein